MSPIRAENRARYPEDWPLISERIRYSRAHGRCECEGECGTGHEGRCEARNRQPHPVTGSIVVLTVAHRDHMPENCDDGNLFAACQRCHLAYDREHHAQTAVRTRQALATAGMEPLFEQQTGPAATAQTAEQADAGLLSTDMVREAGISFRQLDYWTRTGRLLPADSPTGRNGSQGFKRRWTRAELGVARVLGRLTAAGLPLETATRIARSGESRTEIAPGIWIEVEL